MRPAGRQGGRRRGFARAAIAVAALYALVLQAVLGGLMPIPAPADGLICASAHAAAPDDGGRASHDHAGCCTVAQPSGAAIPARPSSAAAIRTARAETRIAWAVPETARARARPGGAIRARGPPAA